MHAIIVIDYYYLRAHWHKKQGAEGKKQQTKNGRYRYRREREWREQREIKPVVNLHPTDKFYDQLSQKSADGDRPCGGRVLYSKTADDGANNYPRAVVHTPPITYQ